MFITFEGIEGSGKTTQARLLFQHLRKKGFSCILTREPGGTKIGEQIRAILLKDENRGMFPLAEFFLYEADRVQHFREVIKPNLQQGCFVISDRSLDATTVYQGFGRGVDLGLIRELNQISYEGTEPDLTFIMDCPPEVGLSRAKGRAEMSPEEEGFLRFEKEELQFHKKIREGYLHLSKTHPRFQVLDATKEALLLHQQILTILRERFLGIGV